MPRSHGLFHIGFLLVSGLAGWVLLTVFTLWPMDVFRPFQLTPEVSACFAMAAMARLLAVRVFRRVRIALDSAFYVSAAFIFGSVPAAWMVLLVFTADAVVRYVRGSGIVARREAPKRFVIAHIVHNGGLPALVLLVAALAFGVDAAAPHANSELAWRQPLFAVSFLLVHYFFAGGSHWFDGAPSKTLWREFFSRVVLAEASLVPLAFSMVLGYMHQGIELYLMLGVTCLFFNVIFRRASIIGEKLHERIEELSTLDKVGRLLSGSLERRTLVSNIAGETLRLVRHTSRFTLGLVDPKTQMVTYEVFDESGKANTSFSAPRDEGLSGWVMLHRQPLLLGDLRRDYELYAKSQAHTDRGYQSWLGVPLIIYDEVMGVMSVQSEQMHAYTVDHLRVLTTIADQAAVALENARLYELATVDGLSSLLVRRYFDQRLEEEWRRSQRYGSAFTLGIIDLDDFKHLNDTFGHQAGDQVLRAAAQALKRNMRGPDLAGRYGGEEFAFILPRTRLAESVVVAERIRADLERMEVSHAGQVLKVTASIGLACFPESGARDPSELISQADHAMYQAKRLGKNRLVTSVEARESEADAAKVALGPHGVV